MCYNLLNFLNRNIYSIKTKILNHIKFKSVDESIYKDIEDLEFAYDMIKKLEEINQIPDELIIEKLIKQL